MRELDPDKVKQFVESFYVARIMREYGDSGIDTLRSVMEQVRRLFVHIEPELVKGPIIVFKVIGDSSIRTDDWATLTDIAHFTQEYPQDGSSQLNIKINSDGTFEYNKDPALDIESLSENAIVYKYHGQQDMFVIKGETQLIVNLCPAYSSIFSVPTYSELKEALEDYKRRYIRTSNCPTFSTCWYGGADGPRLFFNSKPEANMRRSLAHCLSIILRSAEVGQEQVVDESHPVDIKVRWMLCNRNALIEIKWLGKSVNENGEITTEYSESRAKDGAKQLADYIDAEYRHLPTHERRGYLVVIDGRRRNLSEGSSSLDQEDGLWYKEKEIAFDPEYHLERPDFEKPMRMFAGPK